MANNPLLARSPFKPLHVVSLMMADGDPGIDWAAVPDKVLEAYSRTRELELLKPFHREGQAPVLFTIGQMPAIFRAEVIENIMSSAARQMEAFSACVHTITLGNGQVAKAEGLTRVTGGAMLAPSSWLDDCRDAFGMKTILEVGQLALELATMTTAKLALFSPPPGLTPTR